MKIIGIPESLRQIYEIKYCTNKVSIDKIFTPDADVYTFLDDLVGEVTPGSDMDKLRKGATGELMLAQGVYNKLRGEQGYLMHSLWLPYGDSYRKPDHVLIHGCGLAIVETKYWSGNWGVKGVQQELSEHAKALETLLLERTSGVELDILPMIYDPNAALPIWDVLGNDQHPGQKIARKTEYLCGILRHHRRGLSPLMIECFKDILECFVMDLFEEKHMRLMLELQGII